MTATAWRPIWWYVRRTAVLWPQPRTAPEPIRLPDQVADASTAIAAIRELWPVLLEALEPGSTSHHYGRRTDRRPPVGTCDACGGPMRWRSPTSRSATLPTQRPPTLDGSQHDNTLPAVERLRPYCPTCDQPNTPTLAPTQLPIVAAVHDALVDTAAALTHVETYAAGSLDLTALAGADVPARLAHLERLLPSLAGDADLVAEVTVDLISVERAIRRAIRDVEPLIAIDAPARCPWCNGRSLVMWPQRGETRAHDLGDGRPVYVAGVVECTQRDCRCDDETCGCRRRLELVGGHQPHAGYRHQWSNAEWRQLGDRLGVDLYAIAARGSDTR